ncbi:MAG: hypothetical protein AB7N80_11100 [Bdellovibrionales bacterium]
MRSVTEFPVHKLNDASKMKATLAGEGKTPEEISASIGEKYKYEGDKLKHFMNAIEVATQNPERLHRVAVVALNEGENAPAKAVKIEEHHYIPEFGTDPRPVNKEKAPPPGSNRGKGKDRSGPKESPWGLSPEQKAAKKAGGGNKPGPKTP